MPKFWHIFCSEGVPECHSANTARHKRCKKPHSCTLQQRVMQLAHEGHQGIAKTKSLLREKVWFPNIDRRVEAMITNCIA